MKCEERRRNSESHATEDERREHLVKLFGRPVIRLKESEHPLANLEDESITGEMCGCISAVSVSLMCCVKPGKKVQEK